MKHDLIPYLGAVAAAVLLAAYAGHLQGANAVEPNEAATPSVRTSPNQLRYPAGASQLAYLTIQAVRSEVPPVMEPLPARIAFDEDHTVRMFSPIAGRATEILGKPGQTVKAGEVLAWLDSADYSAALADLHKAQADLTLKRQALSRADKLHQAGVIATRELEQAQADLASSQAEHNRASDRLRDLGGHGAEAQGARYALRAPIAGVIAERHLNPGQEVRPDATDPAFVITDLSHLDVVADVAERDVPALKLGQAIHLQADGIDLSGTQGRISTLGAVVDANTRRVPVRAHLTGDIHTLRPEMFVRMAPLTASADPQVLIPNSAIVTTGLQSFVFVEASPGLLVKTRVELLKRYRDVSYVGNGLQAGQRVATQGATLLDAELSPDN